MPIRITYDDEKQGVELFYTGVVNADEIFDAMNKIYTNKKYSSLKYCISDRSNCENLLVDSNDINKLIIQTKSFENLNADLIVAMVSPDDLNFGKSRMYEMKIDDLQLKTMVFRNRKDADLWIADELLNS